MSENEVDKDQEIKTIMKYSHLKGVMDHILAQVKEIPQDNIVALKVINLLLEVINAYAEWMRGLQGEIIKLDRLNKAQAEMIRNKGVINTDTPGKDPLEEWKV